MTEKMDQGRILLAVTGWDPEVWLTEFSKVGPHRQVVLDPDGAEDPSIRYAVVWKPRPGLLSSLPNLEVIFSLGAGVDHIFEDPDLPDVPIVRIVSEDLTMRMSEYVAWQVLDHHRLGARYRRQQANHVWHEDRRQPAAHEVTVGILGLGVLGRDAATRLRALGFRVCGWSRRPHHVDDVVSHHGQEGLGAFLAEADIVVCLLPLTPDTRGILSMPLFTRMKQGGPFGAPVLINAGRGALQNEADILAALDRGMISAAALDVFQTEPLPAGSPLWDHPKVTITPHAAASSVAAQLVRPILEQMQAFERGVALRNTVDRRAQY